MFNINDLLLKMSKVPVTAKIFLLQNLSVMIKAGLPLADSLRTLNQQTKNKKLKKILEEIENNIRQGKSFGESLEKYQDDFGEMFINMVKAGEASGQLEGVLKELYLQQKKDHALKAKVKGAMIYPAIILTAMVGIGIFVIVFVLPNLTGMFKEMGVQLPLFTRILIWVSDFTQANGIVLAIVILVLVASLFKFFRTVKGKSVMSWLILKLPVISPIAKKISLAKIARSLSSLIKTDIDIVNTLNITAHVVGNRLYREALLSSAEQVKKGAKLEVIFKTFPNLFPPIITQMVAVGEETGALDEILEKIAEFYEEDVTQTMESLPTIIEPILMLVIGGAVAGIALAIMAPIYSLSQNF